MSIESTTPDVTAEVQLNNALKELQPIREVVKYSDFEVQKASADFIDQKCIACHLQKNKPNFSDLESLGKNTDLVQKFSAENSLVYQSIVRGRMPLGKYATHEEIKQFKCWIDRGAKVETSRALWLVVEPSDQDGSKTC